MALAGAVTDVRARSLSSAASAPLRSYRADIDGLRALAVLSVALNHAGVPMLTGGFTGVDIFFVISGYLIGGNIYAELRMGEFSYLRFYQRRAKRILPAFFAVIACVLVVGLMLLSPAELARLGRSAFAAALSASNVLFWHGANYFDTRSELNPLLMTWSLGVEEQFYAVIPALMMLMVGFRRARMLIAILVVCAASFLLSWIALARDPALAFYMLPMRAWELGIGVALAVAEADSNRSLIPAKAREWTGCAGLALMVAPLFLLNATSAFPGPAALPPVLGAALSIATPESWISRRVLSLRPIVFAGRISYSWYLWHWPALAFLRIVYGRELNSAMAFTAIALSFAVAVCSYYLIEQPFRRSRCAPRPLLFRYAIASGLLMAACALVWKGRGVPMRFPQLARMEAANAQLAADRCLADDGNDRPNLSARCFDDADSRPTVVLWGDSHAAALAPGLREIANAQGYAFAELTKASCPPAMGVTHFVPRHPRLAEECLRYNERAFDLIGKNDRIRMVMLHCAWAGYLHRSWQDGWLATGRGSRSEMPDGKMAGAVLRQSLAETIRGLEAAGKQVIVFDDVPAFDFEPQWRIDTARIPMRRMLARWLGAKGADDPGSTAPGDDDAAAMADSLLRQTLAGEAGATLVDLRAPLCSAAGQCAYRDGDRLLYLDNNHLSPAGARYALREFSLPAPASARSEAARESKR